MQMSPQPAASPSATPAPRSGPPRASALRLYPLRLLVPTVAFVVTVAVVAPLGQRGDLRFYQAAATIIVVLVLSLATQGHFFLLRQQPQPPAWIARRGRRLNWFWVTSEQFAVVGVLAYLGLGEAASLYALASTSPHSILLALSSAAIASGFFAIGTIALLGQMGTQAPPPHIEQGRPVGR